MTKLHILIKIYLGITILLTISSIIKIYNHNSWKKGREHYSVNISIAKEHPISIASIKIVARNNEKYKNMSFYEIDKYSHWGNPYSLSGKIKFLMPPDSLKIAWIGLRERKLYQANFKFPANTIDSIFKYEKDNKLKDRDYTNKTTYYFHFNIGIAPEGYIIIWLSGKNFQKEIARFQAEEVDSVQYGGYIISKDNIDKVIIKSFIEKPGYSDIDSLLVNKVPPELIKWQDRRERFHYYIITKNFPKEITSLKISLFNAEKAIYDITKNNKIEINANAPSFIESNEYTKKRSLEFEFDDTVIAIFKEQQAKLKQNDTLVLSLEYNDKKNSTTALLTSLAEINSMHNKTNEKLLYHNSKPYEVLLWEEHKLKEILSHTNVNGNPLPKGTLKDGNGEVFEYYKAAKLMNKVLIEDGKVADGHFFISMVWNDQEKLNSYAWDAFQYALTAEELDWAILWIERAIALEKNYYNMDTYAALLFKTGKKQHALKIANEAIAIAKKEDIDYTATEKLIEKFNK